MRDFIAENFFPILTSLLGGGSLLGWITERNRRKIEEKKAASDALKSMQIAYDEFTKDSLERYRSLREELEIVNTKLDLVTKELIEERKKNNSLELAYKELQMKLNRIENET